MLKPGQIIQKTLTKKGHKVTIRAPRFSDLENVTDMINSIIIEDDYILLDKQVDLDGQKKWLKKRLAGNKSGDIAYLVAIIDNKVVGSVDISKRIGRASHTGGLGISIAKPFREEGLGTILMETILKLAKENLRVKVAYLEVLANNKRAIKLYEKMGFKEFGTLPKAVKVKNKYIDGINMYKEF